MVLGSQMPSLWPTPLCISPTICAYAHSCRVLVLLVLPVVPWLWYAELERFGDWQHSSVCLMSGSQQCRPAALSECASRQHRTASGTHMKQTCRMSVSLLIHCQYCRHQQPRDFGAACVELSPTQTC